MFLEVPLLAICKLGICGGDGIWLGCPPSNFSDKVALSPTATESRSSVAVKLAARTAEGRHHTNNTSKPKPDRSLGWLRPGAIAL